jgi:hypothetical protein
MLLLVAVPLCPKSRIASNVRPVWPHRTTTGASVTQNGGGASPAKPLSDAAFHANRVITGNFSTFGLREVLVGRRNSLAAAVSARLPAQN